MQWRAVAPIIGATIATGADFELTATPGMHHVPVIGVRARDLNGGGVVVFGADGEPSPGIQALAQGADWLVHEATGAFGGHSTAEAAAELARTAGVRKLLLVHLASSANDLDTHRRAAAAIFGDVILASDLDRYEF